MTNFIMLELKIAEIVMMDAMTALVISVLSA